MHSAKGNGDSMRLKIAVQKSGRLTDNSLDLLSRCGLKYSRGKDQLMCYGENMPLDVLFVRDDDIPDSGAGRRLRFGFGRLERHRGKAPGVRGARHRAAVRDRAVAGFRALQAYASRYPTVSIIRVRARCKASASRPPIRTSWRAFSSSTASPPRSWCCPDRSRSRRGWAGRI